VTAPQIVTYQVEDGTEVLFEIEPVEGYTPAAGLGDVVGVVGKAVEPTIAAAKEVLDRVRRLGPDGVEVKFGVKVTGKANWIVAKVATEGSFEVTLSWHKASTASVASTADRETDAGRE
jgi:hypothetical protein